MGLLDLCEERLHPIQAAMYLGGLDEEGVQGGQEVV